MKDTLISPKTARLAKEKGFDWDSEYSVFTVKDTDKFNEGEMFLLPTQSLLQKWLREKHVKIILPFPVDGLNSWGCKIIEDDFFPIYISDKENEEFSTYEDALEEGLIEALKLI